MKYSFLLLFFLASCTASPEYYSHSQTITLNGISRDTNVFYNGEKVPLETEEDDQKENDEKNSSQKGYTVSRSWGDQELIIRKDGFQDYHLKLDSTFTSEPWATAENSSGEKHYFPLIAMLFPGKTVMGVASTVTSLAGFLFSVVTISPIDASEYAVKTGTSLIELPKDIVLDVYDIISVPGTAIVNPWREFQYDPVVILEPTEEFKKKCSAQPNSFISNEGCHLCSDSAIVLYATEKECARCSNRQWAEGKCSLK